MIAARHYTDLIAWQLAEEIRLLVLPLTSRPAYARDIKACGQTDDAINSVCRNIAEGFGCESHIEFARYLEIARRSLNELLDQLHGAEVKGYVTAADIAPIRELSRRLYPAINGLWSYLKRTPNWKRPGTNSAKRPQHRRNARPDSTNERQPHSTGMRTAPPANPDSTDHRQPNSTDHRQPNSTA